MENIFLQISLALFVVLIISFIMRILKQPLIIGYIISGIIIGPFLLNALPDKETLEIFSQLGVAFLLFIVGLHLNPNTIKDVGKISVITGVGQVIFTSVIGYFIGLWLGFSPLISIYLAVALTFSSTIIIMKLLSDKGALDKLYGKISIGFLLVQDLIAIIILIIVSSMANGGAVTELILKTLIKGVLIFVILLPLGYFILPKIQDAFAKSQELLFIFSITWGLGLASLFYFFGFTIEIGALIAGVMLSSTQYSNQISSKLKPLRDFFLISFFILLGAQMVLENISQMIFPIIIFSLFILIGNPLIVMILMGIFGYSKSTGFMAGLTVAQISEFSLILIALGNKIGHLPNEILSFVTVIGLITIAGSSYMIMYSEKIYSRISNYLGIFERKKIREKEIKQKDYKYFLFGENRIGFSIMKYFINEKKDYLIVDFNPSRINKLKKNNVNCIYGDVSDSEFLENLSLEKAKLIVSTIPEKETNLLILEELKRRNKNCVFLATARNITETLELYEKGVDYVILPHFLGGEHTAELIKDFKENKELYRKEKFKHLRELKERLMDKQEHPQIERG